MPRPDHGAATWPPRRRPGLLALVLLGHLGLLLGWHFVLQPRMRAVPPPVHPAALVWLNLAARPSPGADQAVAPQPRRPGAGPETRHPPPAGPPSPRPAPTPPAEARRTPETDPTLLSSAIHLPAPEAPASAASAPPQRLMDTAATRDAIRQSARAALWAERAASATDQAWVSKTQKQAEGVARSAKGDCLKGEFVGGGGGLLSLPFAVAAGLRGQCAR